MKFSFLYPNKVSVPLWQLRQNNRPEFPFGHIVNVPPIRPFVGKSRNHEIDLALSTNSGRQESSMLLLMVN
jgi:hypothetical protein